MGPLISGLSKDRPLGLGLSLTPPKRRRPSSACAAGQGLMRGAMRPLSSPRRAGWSFACFRHGKSVTWTPETEPALAGALSHRSNPGAAGRSAACRPGHGPEAHRPRWPLPASRCGAAADQPDGGVAPKGAPGDSSGQEEGPRRPAPAAGGGGLRPPRVSCPACGKSQRTRRPLA